MIPLSSLTLVFKKPLRYCLASAVWVGIVWAVGLSSQAASPRLTTCPTDVESLTTQLLQDLPAYANRARQRARRLNKINIYSSVILAGRPEFTPLTLGPGEYTPSDPIASSQQPQQVFITTLERQYTAGRIVELQQYHWLFLTQTPSGWRLAIMFSRTGHPLTPPRESSTGDIAQGISAWLRDCQAGSIRF